MKFVSEIAKSVKIYENTKVNELRPDGAITDKGKIKAKKIIVTTHFPFINKHGGYFMKMYDIPVGPAILGIILADLLELNFRRAAMMTANNPIKLIINIVTEPVSLVLLIIISVMLITSSKKYKAWRDRRAEAKK